MTGPGIMGVSEGLLPAHWLWICHGLYAMVLWAAIRNAEWYRLWQYRSLQHLAGISVVSLVLLWQIRTGLVPGLEIHFLGLTALTLTMGWSFAVILASLALLATTLAGTEDFGAFSLTALMTCVVPICVSYLACLIERAMGTRIFFAYIFVCGFFGAALAVICANVGMALVLWLGEAYSFRQIWDNLLMYIPLIALPEGVINGILTTGLMVFLPQYLKTLEPARYGLRH